MRLYHQLCYVCLCLYSDFDRDDDAADDDAADEYVRTIVYGPVVLVSP